MLLVLGLAASERLAGAYGVAVCTLAADSLLFLVVLRRVFQKSWAIMAAAIPSADSYGHTLDYRQYR